MSGPPGAAENHGGGAMSGARAFLVVVVVAWGTPARAEPLRFAWPVPSRAQVTEKVQKGGTGATLQYDLNVALAADGQRLAVTLTNFQVVEFAGIDPKAATNGSNAKKSAKLRKQIEAAVKVAEAVPTLIVSKAGKLEDVADVEKAAEKALAAVPKAQRKKLAAAMSSPEGLAAIRRRSGELWDVWVGFWAGRNLSPGRPIELELGAVGATDVPLPMTLRNEGLGGPPGHVRLSFDSTLDSKTTPKALGAWLATFLQQAAAATGGPIPRDLVEGARVVWRGEVLTDPTTLRPAAARVVREVALKLKGEGPTAEAEVHEYRFVFAK